MQRAVVVLTGARARTCTLTPLSSPSLLSRLHVQLLPTHAQSWNTLHLLPTHNGNTLHLLPTHNGNTSHLLPTHNGNTLHLMPTHVQDGWNRQMPSLANDTCFATACFPTTTTTTTTSQQLLNRMRNALPSKTLDTHTRTQTHTQARTHTHTQTHTHARTHTHTHTHTQARTHTQAHTHTSLHPHIPRDQLSPFTCVCTGTAMSHRRSFAIATEVAAAMGQKAEGARGTPDAAIVKSLPRSVSTVPLLSRLSLAVYLFFCCCYFLSLFFVFFVFLSFFSSFFCLFFFLLSICVGASHSLCLAFCFSFLVPLFPLPSLSSLSLPLSLSLSLSPSPSLRFFSVCLYGCLSHSFSLSPHSPLTVCGFVPFCGFLFSLCLITETQNGTSDFLQWEPVMCD